MSCLCFFVPHATACLSSLSCESVSSSISISNSPFPQSAAFTHLSVRSPARLRCSLAQAFARLFVPAVRFPSSVFLQRLLVPAIARPSVSGVGSSKSPLPWLSRRSVSLICLSPALARRSGRSPKLSLARPSPSASVRLQRWLVQAFARLSVRRAHVPGARPFAPRPAPAILADGCYLPQHSCMLSR